MSSLPHQLVPPPTPTRRVNYRGLSGSILLRLDGVGGRTGRSERDVRDVRGGDRVGQPPQEATAFGLRPRCERDDHLAPLNCRVSESEGRGRFTGTEGVGHGRAPDGRGLRVVVGALTRASKRAGTPDQTRQ